jgi:hypothetical protein
MKIEAKDNTRNYKGSDLMGIEDEIFDDFFSKLETAKVPAALIAKLKKLRESNELDAMEKILNILKGEEQNGANKGN